MFTIELRNLCNKKSWRLPTYSIKKQGPDHVPRFSSTVNVNGKDFDSPETSKNKKGTQNEAAEVALKYFSMTDTRASIPMDCLRRLTDSPDHENSNVELDIFPKMPFKSLKYIPREEGPDHITCLSGAVTDKTSNKAENETTKLASNHFFIDYTKPPIPKASSFPQPSLTLPSDCLTRPTAANQENSHVEQINQMEISSSEANTEQGIPSNMKRRHNDLVTTDRIAKRRRQECFKSRGLKAEPVDLDHYSKKALEQISTEKAASSNSSGEQISDSTLLSNPILETKLILNPEEQDKTITHNTTKTSNEAQNETAKLAVNQFFIDYTKPPIPSASYFPQPSLTLPSDCLTRPAAANQESSHVEQINQMEIFSSEANTEQGIPANTKRSRNELVTTDQIAKRRCQECSKSQVLKAEPVNRDRYSKKALEQISSEKAGSRNSTEEQISDCTVLSDPILETKLILNPEEQDKTISLSPISLFQVCMKAFVKAENQIKRLNMELKESEKKHKKELEEMKKKHEEEIKGITDKRENGKKIWERSSKKY